MILAILTNIIFTLAFLTVMVHLFKWTMFAIPVISRMLSKFEQKTGLSDKLSKFFFG